MKGKNQNLVKSKRAGNIHDTAIRGALLNQMH